MATFETTVPEWPAFDAKYLPHSRIVALEEGELTGWAALSPVSARDCYSGVAEVSVYVAQAHQRKRHWPYPAAGTDQRERKEWYLVTAQCYL